MQQEEEGRRGACQNKRPVDGTVVGHHCLDGMVTSRSRVPSPLWHILCFLYSHQLHSSLTAQLGLTLESQPQSPKVP